MILVLRWKFCNIREEITSCKTIVRFYFFYINKSYKSPIVSIKHRNCWVLEYSKYNIHILKPIHAQQVINKTTIKRTTCQCYHISRKRASNGPVQYLEKKNESEDGTFQMNLMKKGSFYCQILSWFRKWESEIQII